MSREATEPETLLRLMDALKQASGCAHQLAHMQQNPGFLALRDALEATHVTAMKMATRSPLPRQDVLAQLEERARAMNNG